MNELAQAQLSAITEVLHAANTLGVEVWLRGGWAMDFYLGQVTRDHVDVDWFVWRKDLPVISGLLISRGWADLADHPLDQQRDLLRDQVELGFAPLARSDGGEVVVGGGPKTQPVKSAARRKPATTSQGARSNNSLSKRTV